MGGGFRGPRDLSSRNKISMRGELAKGRILAFFQNGLGGRPSGKKEGSRKGQGRGKIRAYPSSPTLIQVEKLYMPQCLLSLGQLPLPLPPTSVKLFLTVQNQK